MVPTKSGQILSLSGAVRNLPVAAVRKVTAPCKKKSSARPCSLLFKLRQTIVKPSLQPTTSLTHSGLSLSHFCFVLLRPVTPALASAGLFWPSKWHNKTTQMPWISMFSFLPLNTKSSPTTNLLGKVLWVRAVLEKGFMTPIGYAIKPLVYYFCADLYVINIFLLYFPQKKIFSLKK